MNCQDTRIEHACCNGVLWEMGMKEKQHEAMTPAASTGLLYYEWVVQTIRVCFCIIYGMMIMYLVLRVGVWVVVGCGVWHTLPHYLSSIPYAWK